MSAPDPSRAAAMRLLLDGNGARVSSQPTALSFLIDAARDDDIYPRLRSFAADRLVVGLYEGAAATELAPVAPYLLRCEPDGPVLDWLWREGWARSWGIFIRSAATTAELRRHFRRLTQVKTEDGRVLLFRFYDPRVFAAFAPTCNAEQAEALFGPIDGVTIDLSRDEIVEFWREDEAVRQQTKLITGGQPRPLEAA
jgi:hypothetical protein